MAIRASDLPEVAISPGRDELLVPIGGASSLGSALTYSRTVPNGAPWLLALMIVILVIGMVMDAIFGVFTRRIRDKRGPHQQGVTIRLLPRGGGLTSVGLPPR